MISRLQRPDDRNLDAMAKEQISEATRRVKDEQVHANRRLEQLNKEVQSWITDYWGFTEASPEVRIQVFSDPIQGLWERINADMKSSEAPSPSEYGYVLKITLDVLSSTTNEREEKRSTFEEAEQANAAQRDAMIQQLCEEVRTMKEWLELFTSGKLPCLKS